MACCVIRRFDGVGLALLEYWGAIDFFFFSSCCGSGALRALFVCLFIWFGCVLIF